SSVFLPWRWHRYGIFDMSFHALLRTRGLCSPQSMGVRSYIQAFSLGLFVFSLDHTHFCMYDRLGKIVHLLETIFQCFLRRTDVPLDTYLSWIRDCYGE